MAKREIKIREVANGFIARIAEDFVQGSGMEFGTDDHVFTDPEELGRWVAHQLRPGGPDRGDK